MYFVVRHDLDKPGFSWVSDEVEYQTHDYWNYGEHAEILSSHQTKEDAERASAEYNATNRKTAECR